MTPPREPPVPPAQPGWRRGVVLLVFVQLAAAAFLAATLRASLLPSF